MSERPAAGTPIRLADFEQTARERLGALVFDYFAGGAHDEITLRENRRAFDDLALGYRVLVDVSRRDLSTSVLGVRIPAPIVVAPTAFQRLAHPDGELATARACGATGTPMTLSTLSTTRLEDVRAGAGAAPLWFQLYVFKDRGVTRAFVKRAEAAGCSALVLTVDAPVLGGRERDVRNRFALPSDLRIANAGDASAEAGALPDAPSGSALAGYIAEHVDPSISWRDVEWLRAETRLPLLVKGLVRADDALRAADAGAAAVVVSNHGGRQLDTAVATVRALPAVAAALAARAPHVEILLDGGVRRGTDVVKALALGARAVMLGRPILWGLAAGGAAGAERVLTLLRDELSLAMALCGCPRVADVTPDLIWSDAR